MPTLLTNPRAASGGSIYALLGRMAHRNSPDEYVVQASGLLDHALEGHGRLPGRSSLSPVFGTEAVATSAAIKRNSSNVNKKKAATTGPKKKRRPPKVPWKKPKGMIIYVVHWISAKMAKRRFAQAPPYFPFNYFSRHAKKTPVSLQSLLCV